jgi:hypothetical protein
VSTDPIRARLDELFHDEECQLVPYYDALRAVLDLADFFTDNNALREKIRQTVAAALGVEAQR